ncbi:nucleoporin NUP188-like protein [Senna tora]|uniref:Nucleoporin NUP188-like protein n=1 Tax=Senna tora TaxID=362788 RepID=A0A834SML5_9FABA|nr:nucleoporin NUP188-like protein [Senna tora]
MGDDAEVPVNDDEAEGRQAACNADVGEPEDNNPILILDILCKIYRGEESLCIQFWVKESYIDGLIWCLLCNLESEFPFQTVKLVQVLSSLCEGTWPAEYVYNFLDKSVGVSTLFEISNDSLLNGSHIVEARQPVCVHGIEGLFILVGTCGHVLKAIGENTALVRWKEHHIQIGYGSMTVIVYGDQDKPALIIYPD